MKIPWEEEKFYKTVTGAVFGGAIAGVIIHNQPKAKHVGAAEQSLIRWIMDTKLAKNVISKESISERIKTLTQFQKTNSARASGK